jgi:tetratricopeptide (TPR) repeat protein
MRLGERYEVVEVLSGGMGEVFLCGYAGDDGQRTRVALKTFQQRFFFDNSVRNAFIREASVWLRLTGLPHVLPALGIEQIERRPFIQMLPVASEDGVRTLADLIVRVRIRPVDALHFAWQIALAMQQAASRVPELVHGDLKPANVLLMRGKAYVADFGLANAATLGRADPRLVGTRAYRAPELDGRDGAPTVASDVYAFGRSLAELLAGAGANDPVAAAGRELVRTCTAADPEARPRTFAEVFQRVVDLLEEYDPAGLLLGMMHAARYVDGFRQDAGRLHAERVRSLISLGETRQALEVLDALPSEEYTPELWLRRAMALSMENRAEEAIEALRPALEREEDLEPASRVLAHSEYALCLKRLNRLDEAEKVYEKLLLEVDDEHLPIVVINLATVHLQQRRPADAVRLLEPFLRKHPERAEAWSNLGRAYMEAQRYTDAEKAFGRALQRDPSAGIVRVWLAELYMDHMKRVPEAWAALDAAFDVGYESRELLVRLLACSMLLRREDTLAGLAHALENNFDEEAANTIFQDALAMARRIAGGEEPPAIPEPPAMPEPPVPAPPAQAVEPPADPRQASVPFLNLRFYTTGDFTIDFYEDPHAPDFLENFVREWRRGMRDPRMQLQGASLRGSPFYFTRCPECGVYVVTNRAIGYKLDCRMCSTRWFTSAIEDPFLSELTSHIAEITGTEEMEENEGGVYALLVQASDEQQQARVDEVCSGAAMALVPHDQYLAIALLQQAVEHGVCELGRPWSVWTMPAEVRRWARDATPPEIGAVVRALQAAVPGARSLSSTLSRESVEALRGSAREHIERDEQEIREKLRRHDASVEEMLRLADAVSQRGETVEAEQLARAALGMDDRSANGWQMLGLIYARAERFGAACAPLERSLALDPARAMNWRMLAVCREKSGDPEGAREAYLRAIAIAGGEPPLPAL